MYRACLRNYYNESRDIQGGQKDKNNFLTSMMQFIKNVAMFVQVVWRSDPYPSSWTWTTLSNTSSRRGESSFQHYGFKGRIFTIQLFGNYCLKVLNYVRRVYICVRSAPWHRPAVPVSPNQLGKVIQIVLSVESRLFLWPVTRI